ncbi:MAG: YraN family protein [Chloroflexi bacterium RBG_19FT_COMBO_47_9]|nr:MAG: YraN family protein [Chloroflexi bacterium RBG_19FT_COMBO_47_9]
MTQTSHQRLGKWGEETAARYLAAHGHQILETNYRTPYGEIDLITRLGDAIIFVEVKTRSSPTLGMPEISVTPRKKLHMIQSAEYYIQQHSQASDTWRIDVIAVQRHKSDQTPEITHFENAIA